MNENLFRTIDPSEPLVIRCRLEADGALVPPGEISRMICEILRINPATQRTAADQNGQWDIAPIPPGTLYKNAQPWERDDRGYNFLYTVPTAMIPTDPGFYLFVLTFYAKTFVRTLNLLYRIQNENL